MFLNRKEDLFREFKMNAKLYQIEIIIYNFLVKNGESNIVDISKALNLSYERVENHTQKMVGRRELIREKRGSPYVFCYQINNSKDARKPVSFDQLKFEF